MANVGNIDRAVRLVLGLVLWVSVFVGPLSAQGTWVKVALAVVGAILVLTSVFKFCPAYRLLGLNTCRTK